MWSMQRFKSLTHGCRMRNLSLSTHRTKESGREARETYLLEWGEVDTTSAGSETAQTVAAKTPLHIFRLCRHVGKALFQNHESSRKQDDREALRSSTVPQVLITLELSFGQNRQKKPEPKKGYATYASCNFQRKVLPIICPVHIWLLILSSSWSY